MNIKPQRIALIVVDALLLGISWAFAYLFVFLNTSDLAGKQRFIGEDYFLQLQLLLPWVVLTHLLLLAAFQLYRGMVRYAGTTELTAISAATFCQLLLWVGINLFLETQSQLFELPQRQLADGSFQVIRISYKVLMVYSFLSLFSTGGWRFGRRLLVEATVRSEGAEAPAALIVGAGDVADSVLRNLARGAMPDLRPVAAVSDKESQVGMRLHGVPVVATLDKIADVLKEYEIHRVLIALDEATPQVVRTVVAACDQAEVNFRIVPSLRDIAGGKVEISQTREIQIEDLLGREPVDLDLPADRNYLRDEVVLITGAGGSIGSELARQAARSGAKTLLLLGKGENSIFCIANELARSNPAVQTVPLIADIRDATRLRKVFAQHRPGIVFHAAAHKHVPLMESAPEEAIKNNVIGTWNVVQMAEHYGAKRFVLISSDKAVSPSSMMGATKRFAEMILWAVAAESRCVFQAVRFGNVLGSRGSVIPTFRDQIRAGGPVTVTHPDITRYFMTIPEAVNLVLQAGSRGVNGALYILDMGEPIRIADLARNMIVLCGYRPDVDIKIEYTGLRPGEKLTESLMTEFEESQRTEIAKISIAKTRRHLPLADVEEAIEALAGLAHKGDINAIYLRLQQIIPDYHPQGRPELPEEQLREQMTETLAPAHDQSAIVADFQQMEAHARAIVTEDTIANPDEVREPSEDDDEGDTVDAQAAQDKIDRVDLHSLEITAALLKTVPKAVAKDLKVFPVALAESHIVVAISNPLDITVASNLEEALGRPVRTVLASEEEIDLFFKRYYEGEPDDVYSTATNGAETIEAAETAEQEAQFVAEQTELPITEPTQPVQDLSPEEPDPVEQVLEPLPAEPAEIGSDENQDADEVLWPAGQETEPEPEELESAGPSDPAEDAVGEPEQVPDSPPEAGGAPGEVREPGQALDSDDQSHRGSGETPVAPEFIPGSVGESERTPEGVPHEPETPVEPAPEPEPVEAVEEKLAEDPAPPAIAEPALADDIPTEETDEVLAVASEELPAANPHAMPQLSFLPLEDDEPAEDDEPVVTEVASAEEPAADAAPIPVEEPPPVSQENLHPADQPYGPAVPGPESAADPILNQELGPEEEIAADLAAHEEDVIAREFPPVDENDPGSPFGQGEKPSTPVESDPQSFAAPTQEPAPGGELSWDKETEEIMTASASVNGPKAVLLLRVTKGSDAETLKLLVKQLQDNVLSAGDSLVVAGPAEFVSGLGVATLVTGTKPEGAITQEALDLNPEAGMLLTLSSDTLLSAQTLNLFRAAVATKGVVLAYSNYLEDREGATSEVKLHDHEGCPHERFEYGPVIGYCAGAIKKVGGVRRDYNAAWEYDLHLKLMEIGSFHRIQEFSYTRFIPVVVDAKGSKVFSPGMGPLGGFSYVFYPADVEKEVTEAFEAALKRRGAWIDHEVATVNHGDRKYEVMATVVIPILNRVKFIGNAIDKVLSGTYQNFEIVLVDNGSTDGTVEKVQEYVAKDKRIRLLHGKGGSIASALNEGIRAARGKYICQLDSDDEYAPDTIEQVVNHLESHPKCGLAITYYRLMDEHGNIIEDIAPITHSGYSRNQVVRRDGAGATRIFPKIVLEEFGLYDEEHYGNFGEDYDMVLKVGEKYSVDRVHKVLYHYRRHSDNTDVTRDPAMKYKNKNRSRQEALRRRKEINQKLGKA